MQLWHVSFSAATRMPLFSTESLRRKAVRLLARIVGSVMVLFSIVDEHLHLVSIGDREQTRRLRQSIHRAASSISEAPVAPSWAGPVKDRKHLLTLVRYHLCQVVKHKVQGAHPALWSGSCFQDLIGARCIEGLQLQTRRVLPRQQIEQLARDEVGLHGVDIRPIDLSDLRRMGMGRMAGAAAAALAAEPTLGGRSRAEWVARRAAAHLGLRAGISRREVRWALGLKRQGLSALLRKEAPEEILRATRIRLSLEVEIEGRFKSTAAVGWPGC
jgi:hypothetical protein